MDYADFRIHHTGHNSVESLKIFYSKVQKKNNLDTLDGLSILPAEMEAREAFVRVLKLSQQQGKYIQMDIYFCESFKISYLTYKAYKSYRGTALSIISTENNYTYLTYDPPVKGSSSMAHFVDLGQIFFE